MAAPTLSEVRREVARVARALPDMTRKAAFLQEKQDAVDESRADLIATVANLIHNCDRIKELLAGMSPEKRAEYPTLLEETELHRKQAFDLMRKYNPDQAWFWAEDRQMPDRSGERMPAPSRPLPAMSKEAMDAAYAEMALDAVGEAEALDWIEGFVGETLE